MIPSSPLPRPRPQTQGLSKRNAHPFLNNLCQSQAIPRPSRRAPPGDYTYSATGTPTNAPVAVSSLRTHLTSRSASPSLSEHAIAIAIPFHAGHCMPCRVCLCSLFACFVADSLAGPRYEFSLSFSLFSSQQQQQLRARHAALDWTGLDCWRLLVCETLPKPRQAESGRWILDSTPLQHHWHENNAGQASAVYRARFST